MSQDLAALPVYCPPPTARSSKVKPPYALGSVSQKKFAQIVFSTSLKHSLLLCFIKSFLFLQTLNFLKICFICFLIIFVIIKLYNRVIIIKKY